MTTYSDMESANLICGHTTSYFISPRKVTISRGGAVIGVARNKAAVELARIIRGADSAVALDLLADRLIGGEC